MVRNQGFKMPSNDTQAEPNEDRRKSPRIPVEIWVEESTKRELYFQRGANLSAGGIYLERTIPHVSGTLINLRFALPDNSAPIRVRGEIVNVGDEPEELGMGVKFLNLNDVDRQRIHAFIERASDGQS